MANGWTSERRAAASGSNPTLEAVGTVHRPQDAEGKARVSRNAFRTDGVSNCGN